MTPQGEIGHISLESQNVLWVLWELCTKGFLQNYIILIIGKIIQDFIWSIRPILKVELLRKLCLK